MSATATSNLAPVFLSPRSADLFSGTGTAALGGTARWSWAAVWLVVIRRSTCAKKDDSGHYDSPGKLFSRPSAPSIA